MTLLRTLFAAFALTCGAFVAAQQPVDINVADANALAEAIKGVGIKKAQAIVSYREKNGAFSSVDDLRLVDGIGEKTVDESRDALTAGAAAK